jgi:serine/threonine protein kinase/Flp pilus assembly protein TadD
LRSFANSLCVLCVKVTPDHVMTPERWQQIDQLFHSAVERDSGERAAFLSEACAGDDSLRKEVQSLIESHELSDSFIETPAADLAAELLGSGEARLTAGQSVGPYRIVSLLGEGGMGEVYLADDTRLNRKIALKLLPPHFTINPDRVRRFDREARAASALNHPNIVTIYEIGQSDSAHFIATEFVDGKTLRQLINEKPFTLSEALNVTIQVAGALTGAHAAGIVHRDIKPENIMLRADGYVKILDFGLAKLTEAQITDSELETPTLLQSNPGLLMGTVQYMSPEQARGKKVDARSDIWSLGVVLFELLAGRVPFSGETPSHVMVSLMEDELPPLTSYADVPAELERIVSKALRKNQKQRYQTVSRLALDLKSLKRELQLEAHLKGSLEAVPSSKERTTKSDGQAVSAARASAKRTVDIGVAHPTSSAEYLVSEIRRHKRVVLPVLAALAAFGALTAMAAYFAYSRYWAEGGRANVSSAVSIRSVAVLPFENQTNDANSEYLSDGISESLINSLSQLPGIKVSSRNSSFKYKGKNADPQEVAKALGVETIMTGRVEQRGDNLLISVELVDARDRTQVWGEQYNRKAADLLAIQSEISSEIARKLRLHLTAGEQQQLAKHETVNLQAYELLLKGRFSWRKGGTANRKAAVEYYRQATAVDPSYALAYAEISGSYDSLITNNELDPKEFAPRAEAAARKALDLDENLAEAHLAMASVKVSAWDWAAAEHEIKRTLEVNPNLVRAHSKYGVYLMTHGRREEAVVELDRVRELDPLAPSAKWAVINRLSMLRQNEPALDAAKKLLELDQGSPDAQIRVGTLYLRLGRYREAIAAYQEAIKLGEDNPDSQILLGAAYARSGERDKTRAILKRLETGKEYVSPVGFAVLHFALGERDQGFAALEAAYAAHDQQLIWLRGEWEFDQLHSDPRFEDLVRRIGLN